MQTTAGDVQNFSTTVTTKHAQARSGVVGVIAQAMKGAPKEVVRNASDVARTVLSGGGTIAWFGGRIEEFDGVVASLNAQIMQEPQDKKAETKARLQPRYASALESLERDGRTVRTRLEKPLDRSTVTALYAAGALPSYVGNVFPQIDFSKVKLEALPYDLAAMSDQALADHLLKNPELAHLLPVVPVAAKKIIGKELAERARSLRTVDQKTFERSLDGFGDLAILLEAYGTDSTVATTFLKDIGPKGFLDLSGRVALASTGDPDSASFSQKEWPVLARLQDALAGTLAAGTQRPIPGHPLGAVPESDSYVPEQWVTDLLREGRQLMTVTQLDTDAKPLVYGYQLLAPLLEHKDSNANFLNRVGIDMVDFERQYAAKHHGRLPWEGTDLTGRLDWRGGASDTNPAGADPVTGLMKALGTNAEAARDFFTSSAEVSGEDGKTRLPMVDYLLTDRSWPGDGVRDWSGKPPSPGDPDPSGISYLGGALKQATLDQPDQRSVQIVESIVAETYQEFTEETKKTFSQKDFVDPVLRKDLSDIAGRYMPSLFVSFSGDGDAFVDTSDNRVFDDARVPEKQAMWFLAEMGKDPVAHENLTGCTNAYLVDELRRDLDGVKNPIEVGPRTTETVAVSAEVRAALDYGGEVAANKKLANDAEHNKDADQAFGVVGKLLGETVGKVPVAGTVFEQISAEIGKGLHRESRGEVNQELGEIFRGGADAHERLVRGVLWHSIPPGEGPPGVPPGADIKTLSAEQKASYTAWCKDSTKAWAVELGSSTAAAETTYAAKHNEVKKSIEPTKAEEN